MDMRELLAYKIRPDCDLISVGKVIRSAVSRKSFPFTGTSIEESPAGFCITGSLPGESFEYSSQVYIWGDGSNSYKLLLINAGLPFPEFEPEQRSDTDYAKELIAYNKLLSRLHKSVEGSLRRRRMLI